MSETETPEAPAWRWQGFYGPMAAAVAAKALTDAMGPPDVAAWVPVQGEAPMPVDPDGTDGMFAVAVRPDEPIPVPDGVKEANPAMVGRMIGA